MRSLSFYLGNFGALGLKGPGELGDPLWTSTEASFTCEATGAMVGPWLADLRVWLFGTSARLRSKITLYIGQLNMAWWEGRGLRK